MLCPECRAEMFGTGFFKGGPIFSHSVAQTLTLIHLGGRLGRMSCRLGPSRVQVKLYKGWLRDLVLLPRNV